MLSQEVMQRLRFIWEPSVFGIYNLLGNYTVAVFSYYLVHFIVSTLCFFRNPQEENRQYLLRQPPVKHVLNACIVIGKTKLKKKNTLEYYATHQMLIKSKDMC